MPFAERNSAVASWDQDPSRFVAEFYLDLRQRWDAAPQKRPIGQKVNTKGRTTAVGKKERIKAAGGPEMFGTVHVVVVANVVAVAVTILFVFACFCSAAFFLLTDVCFFRV